MVLMVRWWSSDGDVADVTVVSVAFVIKSFFLFKLLMLVAFVVLVVVYFYFYFIY